MRTLLLLCLTVFSFGFVQAQDCEEADVTVLAGNYYYIPQTLTITAGETIAFQNEGGFHNVNGVESTTDATWSNPETFFLGSNSGVPGGACMGTVTLYTPGTYQYDCSIGSHAANGMVGTIIVEGAPVSASSPTDNAPNPTLDAADVASVYGDSYNTSLATNYNPWWWQSGDVDENFDPGTGNPVLFYSNFNYQGTDMTATNLSGMTHLHVDVWVPADNDRMLKVSPINSGNGTNEWLVEVPVTPGSWNSVDIPKEDFEGMTWDQVFQMKFDGQFNADGSSNNSPWDVYLDNIYFWNDGTGETTELDYVNVTFNVNMNNETVSSDGVFLAGGADFGFPGDNPMSDDDNDGVWTITKQVIAPYTGNYTFLNGNCGNWSCKENIAGQGCADGQYNDRLLANITEDHTVNTCFGVCSTDTTCTLDVEMHDVTFNVNTANITVGANGLFIGGGGYFGDAMGNMMTDGDGDGVYTVVIPVPDGFTGHFTIINNPADGGDFNAKEDIAGQDCADPDNYNDRYIGPITGPTEINTCFGECTTDGSCSTPEPTVDVTFKVDMSEYENSFETVYVSGTFNNWCGSCNPMNDIGNGIWQVTLPLSSGEIWYKFTVDDWNDQEDFVAGSACTAMDGPNVNRVANIEPEVDLGVVCWNSCFSCGVAAGCTDPDAQNYDSLATEDDGTCSFLVTFSVDMSEYVGEYNSVNLNGSFAGWCGDCIEMQDVNEDGIYSTTEAVVADTIEYKFTLNGWGFQEEFTGSESCTSTIDGYVNRSYIVDGNANLPVVCYNSCTACEDDNGGEDLADSLSVSLSVDMNNYDGIFNFVNVSGTWNDFCADCNQMTDEDGDGVWTTTLDLPIGENYRYKYQVNGWEDQEDLAPNDNPVGPCVVKEGGFTNRDLDVAGSDGIIVDTVCWGTCLSCISEGDIQGCNDDSASNYDETATANDGSCIYDVTLSVNMNEYALTENDSVYVNGEFNGWCGECNPMTDDDGDGVWSLTIPLAYDYYEYKFTVNGWNDPENLGSSGCVTENFGYINRVLQLFGNQSEPVVCWNSCSDCEGSGDISGCTDEAAINYASIATVDDGSCQYYVTFSVDMSSEMLDDGATVYVNGTFNAWCGECNPMSNDGMNDIWSLTIPLVEGDHEYKFTINGWNIPEELPIGAPCDFIPNDEFANRGFTLSEDLVLGLVCFNSCDVCDASAAGCTDSEAPNYDPDATVDDGSCAYLVTFRVDMSQQEVTNEVYLYYGSQGWTNGSTVMSTPGLNLYQYTVQLANGAYEYKFSNGPNVEDGENVPAECGMGNDLSGFNRELTVDGADLLLDIVCFGSCGACAGCTDPFMIEFNPFAADDDESCENLRIEGCTYEQAVNFNSSANVDDGLCIFNGGSLCPTDIDGDGQTAVGDLLELLGTFGQSCN